MFMSQSNGIVLKLTKRLFLLLSSDVDECSAESSPCDENADCANRDGFYSCTCKQGFTGNGTVCEGNKGNPNLQSKYATVSWDLGPH